MNSTDVVTLFGDDKILSFDLELTRDENSVIWGRSWLVVNSISRARRISHSRS